MKIEGKDPYELIPFHRHLRVVDVCDAMDGRRDAWPGQ